MDILSVEECWIRYETPEIKVELYFEVTLWKTIQTLMQYSQNKDHQHHKWQQQNHGYHFKVTWMRKTNSWTFWLIWKILRNSWKFQSRNVQTLGYVYRDSNGPTHGPIWKTPLFLLNEICTDPFGKTVVGTAIRENYFGKSSYLGVLNLTQCKKRLFLSVCADDTKLVGKRTLTYGKYSIKKLIWENPHLSLIMYTWVALKDSVK